ncbi:MAG TPA: hypothetical protein VMT54_01860 [Candidatus Cybelea sp.]|nr:hypothetical protein [Candidatus Cybelea sp.]
MIEAAYYLLGFAALLFLALAWPKISDFVRYMAACARQWFDD